MSDYKFYIFTGKIHNTNENYIFINSIKNINMVNSLHKTNNTICANSKIEYADIFHNFNLPINNKLQANLISCLIASVFKFSYSNFKVYYKLTASYYDDLTYEQSIKNFDLSNIPIQDNSFLNCLDTIVNYFIKNKIIINKEILLLKIPINFKCINNKNYYYDKDNDIIMQS